jgi:hypothetical protein
MVLVDLLIQRQCGLLMIFFLVVLGTTRIHSVNPIRHLRYRSMRPKPRVERQCDFLLVVLGTTRIH